MSGSRKYVLDSNIFIQASNTYYGFDLCPGFWTGLIRAHEKKRVFSIDRVKNEIFKPPSDKNKDPDAITSWIQKNVPETFFKQTQDQAVYNEFQSMIEWVQSEPQFKPEAKAEFASVADGWIIAYAKVNGLAVVTHEEYAPYAQKRVPMPNVCVEFDVPYFNTFEMLDDLKIKFILSTKKKK